MTSNSEFKKYRPELVLIGILFVDLFTKVIPVLPLAFCTILLQFYRVGLIGNIVMCFLFLPQFFGALMNGIRISGMGGYFIILGVLLLLYGLITKKIIIHKPLKSFIALLLLFLLFFISLKFSTGGDWALEKWVQTARNGIFALVAFLVLFSNVKKINTILFGTYLILYSFFLLRVSLFVNDISGPLNLFDFGFMRYQTVESLGYNSSVFSISYHMPGYYALQGVALMMMSIKEINKRYLISSLVLSLLVILYSGARQTIVIIVILFFLWGILEQKFLWKSFFVILILLFGVLWLYIKNQGIEELFAPTVELGYVEGGGRGPWLLRGVELFVRNPIFGVGFGRYSLWGSYGIYPHNIIIELLCEIGIFGFIISVLLCLPFLAKTKHFLKFYIYYIMVLLLHAMASGGIESNIVIFSFIFALPGLAYSYNYDKNHCSGAMNFYT